MPKPSTAPYVPLVSIILPVWNGETTLEETLASLSAQTHGALEIIAIDNGSTDKTPALLKAWQAKEPRLRVLTNPRNLGLASSLNLGMAQAKGAYVARMDADDIALPTRIAEQVAFMEANPTLLASGTWAERFGEGTGVIRTPANPHAVRLTALFHSPLIHPSVMFRASALQTLPTPYRSISPVEDYTLWVTLLAIGPVANLPKVLLRYRVVPGSLTARVGSTKRQAMLRAVLALALQNHMAALGFKHALPAPIIDMHARFAGHERLKLWQALALPFWVLLLALTLRPCRVGVPLLAKRVLAYGLATLRGRRFASPPTFFTRIEDITGQEL